MYTAVRGRFSSCWIHPGHCRTIYSLLLQISWNCLWRRGGMQMPDCWASLVLPAQGLALRPFTLWRKGQMAQISASHPRASHSRHTAGLGGLGHASRPLCWASTIRFTAMCERLQYRAGSHLAFFSSINLSVQSGRYRSKLLQSISSLRVNHFVICTQPLAPWGVWKLVVRDSAGAWEGSRMSCHQGHPHLLPAEQLIDSNLLLPGICLASPNTSTCSLRILTFLKWVWYFQSSRLQRKTSKLLKDQRSNKEN